MRVTKAGPDQAAAEFRASAVCAAAGKKEQLEYSYQTGGNKFELSYFFLCL